MPGDFLEDDLAEFFVPGEFGTTARWTPSGGSETPVNGIFDDLKISPDPFTGELESNGGPWFTCALSDVPNIKQGEPIIIPIKGTDKNFTVRKKPSTRSEYTVKIGLDTV